MPNYNCIGHRLETRHGHNAIMDIETCYDITFILKVVNSYVFFALCSKCTWFKHRILSPFGFQEESQSLRRKIERYKRMELASTTDEVLMEEVRTYKVCSITSHTSYTAMCNGIFRHRQKLYFYGYCATPIYCNSLFGYLPLIKCQQSWYLFFECLINFLDS